VYDLVLSGGVPGPVGFPASTVNTTETRTINTAAPAIVVRFIFILFLLDFFLSARFSC
jgi:hypothetical protein